MIQQARARDILGLYYGIDLPDDTAARLDENVKKATVSFVAALLRSDEPQPGFVNSSSGLPRHG